VTPHDETQDAALGGKEYRQKDEKLYPLPNRALVDIGQPN